MPPAAGGGDQTPILLDSTGRAWIGINRTIVIIDPAGGPISTLTLPPVSVGKPGSGLPQLQARDPGKDVAISSLARGPGDTIAVSRDFATELQIVDVSTHRVRTVPLPPDTAVAGLGGTDLASAHNGDDVVAALYTAKGVHEIGQYVNNSWHITSRPCEPLAVVASGDAIAVSGVHCVGVGKTQGSLARLARANIAHLPEMPCVTVTRRATVLACVTGGLRAIENGAASPVISLGRVRLDPQPGSAGGTLAWTWPALICPTDKGIWFTARGVPGKVGLIERQ